MRKVLITVAALAMAFGGANAAIADPGNGNGAPFGPDGINEAHPAWYGLCTAYYNGNGEKNGAPFQALAEHGDDFCEGLRPSNGQGQGKQDDSAAESPGPRGGRG